MLINYKFIKLQPFIRFVDVSATTAAFIRMTVHHQVILSFWWRQQSLPKRQQI